MVRKAIGGATLVLLLFGSVAHAQMRWQDRGFVGASIGAQGGGNDVTVNLSRPVYGEQMLIDATHDVGGGLLWDVAGGYKVWRNLVAGIAYSQFSTEGDVTANVTVPHPLFTDAPRAGTTTASGAERSERAVHFVASWMIPVTDKIDVALSGGPSIFFVAQDLVRDVPFTERSPVGEVDLGAPVISRSSETGAGFNVGAELTYLVRPRWGAAAFLRYTGASVSTGEADLDAGGVHFGVGLRYRF
jgi:hypothetical protein